ncbi:MAG: radical SAM protein [Deltaproteobacteria bacterium]|nr:radical SAM protein [Deltaproteobacteria bacterium]
MTEIINVSFEITQSKVFTVDSFANGISFGPHKPEPGRSEREMYMLRMQDDAELLKLRSRYAIGRSNPLDELEKNLMRLSRKGVLGRSTIYFGLGTDPFLPFEGKFDTSMRFLELFSKYRPGLLVVQTRSPLIVIAMPALKRLGKHVSVTLGVETPDEQAVRRYTPGFPRAKERLKTAQALRHFGIEVGIQVAPLLPYGDWKADAVEFAQILCDHADHLHIRPLSDGSDQGDRRSRSSESAKALARDRKFHWLRPDAANPLITAVELLAPEKLKAPERKHLFNKQMSIFAA